MLIDTSALMAMLLDEPEAERIRRAVDESSVALVGAPTLVEATAVLLARTQDGIADIVHGIAQTVGEPLLLKGDDFAATDVRVAPY